MWFSERTERKRNEKDVKYKTLDDERVGDYKELVDDRWAASDNDGDDELIDSYTAEEMDDDGNMLDDFRDKANQFDDDRVYNHQELENNKKAEFDSDGNDGLNVAKSAETNESRDTELNDNADKGNKLDKSRDNAKHSDDDRVDNHKELEDDDNKADFDIDGDDELNDGRTADVINDSRGIADNLDKGKWSDVKRVTAEKLDEDMFAKHQQLKDDRNVKLDNDGDEVVHNGGTAKRMNDSRDKELNNNLDEEGTRSDSNSNKAKNVDDNQVEEHQDSDNDKQAARKDDLNIENGGDDWLNDERTVEEIGDGRDEELDDSWNEEGKTSDDYRKLENENMDSQIETDGNSSGKETELYYDLDEDQGWDSDDWSEGDYDDGLNEDEEMEDSNPFRRLRGISVDEEIMNNQIMLKFRDWLRLEYLGNKPKTVTQHLRQLAAIWTAIAKENIAEVTNKANIRQFVTEMMESKKLQPGSIRGYLSSLRMFLNFAIEEELPEIDITKATNCKASLVNLSASLRKSIRQRQVDLYVSEVGKFTAYINENHTSRETRLNRNLNKSV